MFGKCKHLFGDFSKNKNFISGTVVLNANASTADAVEFLLKHELTHAIQGTTEWTALETAARNSIGADNFNAVAEQKRAEYQSKGITLDENGVIQEVVAEWVGNNLYRENFIETILQHGDGAKTRNIVQRFRAFFSKNKNSGQDASMQRLERLFRKGIEHRKVAKNETSQFSVQKDSYGEDIVVIDTDQGIFLNVEPKDYPKIVRQYFNERFKGLTVDLGEYRHVAFSKKMPGEYAYPHTTLDNSSPEFAAKMKAITELDALMKTAEPYDFADDTKGHQEANEGWDYFTVTFLCDGRQFSGLINIANSENGEVFYDLTKIKMAPTISERYIALLAQSPSHLRNHPNTTVSQNSFGVNSYDMQNGGENSQFSFGDGTDIFDTPADTVTPIGNEAAVAEAEMFAADADDIAVGHGSDAPVGDDIDTNRRNGRGIAVKLSEGFIEKTLARFGIEELNDYVHVQKNVLNSLLSMGFFTHVETRSRVDVNRQSGMEVEINKSSIDETFNYRNYATSSKTKKVAKIATLEMLPTIIRDGTLVEDDVPDKHTNAANKKFAYIQHKATVDGVPMVVKLAIKKSPNKNKLWVHTVHIEKDTSVQGEEPNKGKQRPSTNTGADEYNSTSFAESQDGIPDAESAMADVEEKVTERKKQKYTKAMQEHDARRAALLQDHKEGRISDTEFLIELRNLEQDAIRETDKKRSAGNRGTAAEKQYASEAVEDYKTHENTRLAQRERRVETAEQRAREKRMAKKCTEIRRSIHAAVDELEFALIFYNSLFIVYSRNPF